MFFFSLVHLSLAMFVEVGMATTSYKDTPEQINALSFVFNK